MVTSYITRYQSSAVLTKNPEIVSLAGEPDRPRATIHNHQEMLLFANRHQYAGRCDIFFFYHPKNLLQAVINVTSTHSS